MKKKIKINNYKLKKNVKYALIILIFIIGVVVFPSTLSRFQSKGQSSAEVDLAFSLLQTEELETSIALDDVLPDGSTHEYSFSVMNYDKDGNRIDVNLYYDITIKVTTNLPIKYELYDSNNNKIDVDLETIQDADGTYFSIFKTNKKLVTYEKDSIETYTIKYSLDSIYNDSDYQDIVELLSIEINAEQVL